MAFIYCSFSLCVSIIVNSFYPSLIRVYFSIVKVFFCGSDDRSLFSTADNDVLVSLLYDLALKNMTNTDLK